MLHLYVKDRTGISRLAIDNLRGICGKLPRGDCRLEIIDILEQPHQACAQMIIAVPTLVRVKPGPMVRVIGDLSDSQAVLAALGMPVP